MNNNSPFLRRCLLLLPLALMVGWDNTAQGFEPRIVFASNRHGNWDIFSMDVHGDDILQLTAHPASDVFPACSPDGRRIAFRSERDGIPDLYVMDRDGKNVIRLTSDNSRDGRPSWSPDGMKIAFASIRRAVGNSEIYVMNADGENEINLTKHKWWDVRASWSPDGSKIAFVSFRDGGADTPRHIFVMNADGTGRRNLTEDTGLTDSFSPTWSPDGSKIAFDSRIHWMSGDIYVMTAEGKKLERLTDKEGTNRQPAYVRNGTRIAFESNRDGDYKIYLMEANGRNAVKLTKTPPGIENVSSSWLPRALAVNPNRKLLTSWGELKRTRTQ